MPEICGKGQSSKVAMGIEATARYAMLRAAVDSYSRIVSLLPKRDLVFKKFVSFGRLVKLNHAGPIWKLKFQLYLIDFAQLVTKVDQLVLRYVCTADVLEVGNV